MITCQNGTDPSELVSHFGPFPSHLSVNVTIIFCNLHRNISLSSSSPSNAQDLFKVPNRPSQMLSRSTVLRPMFGKEDRLSIPGFRSYWIESGLDLELDLELEHEIELELGFERGLRD